MADYSSINVIISDALCSKMEDWSIREEDIKICIGTAEETGLYLRNANDSVCLAKVKLDDTYIVAQYEKDGGTFTLTDTFHHKTEVTGW